MKKGWIIKLIGILLVAVTIVYGIAWFVFIRCDCFPMGAGLSKSDWLAFYASTLILFGTLFLGVIAYMQNISLQKANERFGKANLNMLEQDLKLNGFSSISIELVTIKSDGINLFFKNTGKFYPSTINVISAKQEVENGSKNQLIVSADIQGVYRGTKEYDGYFPLPLSDDNIQKLKEIPLNCNRDNISPQKNLVLWLDYELKNTLGVITRASEKLIAIKTCDDGFVKNCEFITSMEISIQSAES